MDLLLFTLQEDWPVLLPIFIASILLVAVSVNRFNYIRANQRDMDAFIGRLQRELRRGNIDNAISLSEQLDGDVGRVSAEGLQLLRQHPDGFARSFDITIALAVRRLEKGLNVLGTIGTVAPYLGLFGTVVRILFTFGDLANAGGNANSAPEVMFGIGSALIATAFGLGVAILAVVANNFFRNKVSQFEGDFQLLKLVLISARDDHSLDTTVAGDAPTYRSDSSQGGNFAAAGMTPSGQGGF